MLDNLKRWLILHLLKWYRLIHPLLPRGHRPYKVRGGRLYLDLRESRMMFSRALSRYEVKTHQVLADLLAPGAVFVDIGANKGDFALRAASIVGVHGKVFAIEPEPNNAGWLRKSVGLNGYRTITVLEMALGDTNESAELYLGKKSGWHTLKPRLKNRAEGVVSVAKRTLDSVLAENDIEKVDFIKIDVEDSDLEVLEGACRTLSQKNDVIILMEVHHFLDVDSESVAGYFDGLGFTLFHVEGAYDRPILNRDKLTEIVAYRKR